MPDDLGEPIPPTEEARKIKLPSHIGGTPLIDTVHLTEDQRIRFIWSKMMERPLQTIGILVDNLTGDPRKGDRYLKKLQGFEPKIRLLDRKPGPVENVETLYVMYQP